MQVALAFVVLAPAAVAQASGPPANAGRPDDAGRPADVGRPDGQAFSTLDDAVAEHRIDRELVVAVGRGPVEAVVSVDDGGLARSKGEAKGLEQSRRAIDELSVAYGAKKQRTRQRLRGAVEVLADYEHLDKMLVRAPSAAALLALVNDADVVHVAANGDAETGALDVESAAMIRQPAAAAAGATGAGTYVAVLDTGADYRHPDLGSCTSPGVPATCRVAVAYDAAPDDGSLDDDGHGTNVSAIVSGVAPGTQVIAIDVFEGSGTSASHMLAAMNYLIGQRGNGANIVAANMSIWRRGAVHSGPCTDDLAFSTARAVGIVPVVIAGNGGSTAGVSWPACIPGALTVGAVYDANVGGAAWSGCTDSTTWADKVTCFSQSGPTLDMLAPGAMITGGGYRMGGTSQAAPHVAGALALMAQRAPSLGVAWWEWALVNHGPTIRDRDGVDRHRLDVVAALNALSSSADTTKPSVVAPRHRITLNRRLDSTVDVTISWNASDASGIVAYDLYASVNGGTWTRQALATTTSRSMVFALTPGDTYRFTVAAKDGAGNWSDWAYGPTFGVATFDDSSPYVAYSSGWTAKSWTAATNGRLTVSSTTSATATFTFTGRSVAWVATKAANRGQADVYLDGKYQGRWDLSSSTTRARRTVLTAGWNETSTHTLQIVVVGTSGRPAIDVDSFVLLG